MSKIKELLIDDEITLTELECLKLLEYENIFKEENLKCNLMSKKAESNFISEHLIDSLKFKLVNLSDHEINLPCNIIDLGSGGGLPGIPIAITNLESTVTLTESVKKKTDFLSKVITKLELRNCNVINQRIEEIGQDKIFRESFDVVTSRALASLPILLEYALPLLRVGGICIFYKTENEMAETEKLTGVLNLLGGSLSLIKEYKLPLKDIKRLLVVIKKIDKTADRFPRKSAAILKRPLG